jgi:hypothetical protein
MEDEMLMYAIWGRGLVTQDIEQVKAIISKVRKYHKKQVKANQESAQNHHKNTKFTWLIILTIQHIFKGINSGFAKRIKSMYHN